MKKGLFIFIILLTAISCNEDPLPKPKAYLRLDYPAPSYTEVDVDCPYTFEKNEFARDVNTKRNNSCWLNIHYPKMKGTIYLTYHEIRNNLDSLLRDTQNLTLGHVSKADEIAEQIFEDPDNDVYGMVYEVGGNAASQTQFYLTDSVKHFLSGSVYFYSKPNYDSIYPASEYIRRDIKHLMESVRWKKENSLTTQE